MRYRLLFFVAFTFVVVALTAQADVIFVKGRDKITGDVKSENAKGVSVLVKKATETVPGAEVLDVHYDDLKKLEVRIGPYKEAKKADEDSNDTSSAKGKAALTTAIAKYKETLKAMDPHKYAQRTIRYRIAVLMLRQAQLDKTSITPAMTELQKFKADYPDSWQINHVMPLIAQTQMDTGDFKGAMATFDEMAIMETLPTDVRLNAKLMIVQVAVRDGKVELAQKKLAALEAEAAGNPKLTSRVKMAKAEVLVGLKKTDEAVKLLTDVIKESSDKETKAFAHNTLGECLFKSQKYSEARWEFLWVDTVFNQDRAQHAKALYFLVKTFQQLNDEPRAQECRTMLEGAAFAGTEWQQRLLKEGK